MGGDSPSSHDPRRTTARDMSSVFVSDAVGRVETTVLGNTDHWFVMNMDGVLCVVFTFRGTGRDVPALARLDDVVARAREEARVTLAHDREGDMRASGVSSRTCVREARRGEKDAGEERRGEETRKRANCALDI